MELTSTFMDLLDDFRLVFTSPSFATFQLLMTGWILSVRPFKLFLFRNEGTAEEPMFVPFDRSRELLTISV